MFKKTVVSASIAAALLLASGLASAGTATANLAVSASVSASCTISVGAGGLAFGAYDPIGANATAPLNATGSVNVTCTRSATGVTVGMGNGQHFAGGTRQMQSGTDLLGYTVGQPPNNTPGTACVFPAATPWDNTSVLALTPPASKASRSYNVCGSIPAGQDVGAGAGYTDTIIATVNF